MAKKDLEKENLEPKDSEKELQESKSVEEVDLEGEASDLDLDLKDELEEKSKEDSEEIDEESFEELTEEFDEVDDTKEIKDEKKIESEEEIEELDEEKEEEDEDEEIEEVKKALKLINDELKKISVKQEKIKAPLIDGETKVKSAEQPKAMDEVEEMKEVKNHVKKAKLNKKAMGENWSVNDKEIDDSKKDMKAYNISIDDKELKSEKKEIKTPESNLYVSEVKKYYNKLGPTSDELPVSMDKNSALHLTKKIAELERQKAELEKKYAELSQKLAIKEMSDEIEKLASILKSKNLLSEEYEVPFMEFVAEKFANLEAIKGLQKIANMLNVGNHEEIPAEKVIPQVEFTVENGYEGEKSIELMAQIWNKK